MATAPGRRRSTRSCFSHPFHDATIAAIAAIWPTTSRAEAGTGMVHAAPAMVWTTSTSARQYGLPVR